MMSNSIRSGAVGVSRYHTTELSAAVVARRKRGKMTKTWRAPASGCVGCRISIQSLVLTEESVCPPGQSGCNVAACGPMWW